MSKIIVKSKAASFRRAGLVFDRAGRTLDTGKLAQHRLDAILAEPNLIVQQIAEKSDGGKTPPTDPVPPAAESTPTDPATPPAAPVANSTPATPVKAAKTAKVAKALK